MKQDRWKLYIGFCLFPLAIGALSALLSSSGMSQYDMLTPPPLSPPGILFPIVWTVLFLLMGIGSARVYEKCCQGCPNALQVYSIQLALNFFWSIFFFSFQWRFFAFLWLLLLLGAVLSMMRCFYRVDRLSAYLQIPYVFWVLFAGYLNLGFALLNP